MTSVICANYENYWSQIYGPSIGIPVNVYWLYILVNHYSQPLCIQNLKPVIIFSERAFLIVKIIHSTVWQIFFLFRPLEWFNTFITIYKLENYIPTKMISRNLERCVIESTSHILLLCDLSWCLIMWSWILWNDHIHISFKDMIKIVSHFYKLLSTNGIN